MNISRPIFLMLIVFTLFRQPVAAQTISYPVSAQPISVGYDTTLLTVTVSGASANPTISITMPAGIYYIAGSFTFINGSGTVVETGTAKAPSFNLTGASNPFTFTIKRRADCAARSFALSGGTFKDIVKVDLVTENAPLLNTYNIKYATLTITQPAPLTNTALGSNITRNFSFRNTGLGCIDTVFLEIDYGTGGLAPNGNITVEAISFSPNTLLSTATKKIYKIFGIPSMANGLCEADPAIAVIQPVTVTGCTQVGTNYKASWGTNALQLCQTGVNTGNVTVLNTIPLLNSVVVASPAAIPFCAGNPYASFTATVSNTGNGPAANIKFYIANFSGNSFQSGLPLAIDTSSVLVNGVHPSSIFVSASPSWRLSKANGSPACIVGQPGQCLVTMPANFTIPALGSFTIQWNIYNCNGGLCDDGFIAGNPGIKLEYDNECGTQHTTNLAQTTNYGINNQITGQVIQLPAQVVAGDCFNYLLDFNATLSPANGTNKAQRYAEVKLALPTGMSIGNLATDVSEISNNSLPHTGFPKQVGQEVFFRFYPSSSNLVKFKICTTPGGPPCGIIFIPVEITMVSDSSCVASSRITSKRCLTKSIEVLCPGPACAMGGITLKTFSFFRSSYGLPDNNQDGKPDGSGSIDLNKIDRDRYRPGDTLHSEYRGAVANQTSPASITKWNQVLSEWIFSTGTWQGGLASVTIKRAGITYTANSVPVTALVANKNFRANWGAVSFSPAFPAGGYNAGDSIIVAADFIYLPVLSTVGKTTTVADGNLDAPLEVLLTQMVYAAQSVPASTVVIGSTGFTCSVVKYNGNILGFSNNINLLGATGSSCNNITAGFSCFTSFLGGSQTRQYFLNEYRPVVKTDSIIYTIPAGWLYIGQSASNYNYTAKSGSTSSFPAMLTPQVTGSASSGYALKFDVNSAYVNGIFPFIGTEGLNYNGNILFSPGCNTPDSVTISVKEYGHFISYPNKANPVAYINTNTATKAITYSGTSKPGVVIANNTGVVEAATQSNNYWDVQITGTNFNPAKYVWLATEKLTGSGINVLRIEYPIGTALTASGSYGTDKIMYSIASTATNGLVNPNNLVIRIFFSKTGCGTDSVKVRTGWDCSAFAVSADNGCSQDVFLKANSSLSEIQLLKLIEPAPNQTIDICNDIAYRIKITSTQNGDLDNPVVKVTIPPGMELVGNSFKYEYPDASNPEAFIITPVGNVYTLNLEDHSLLPATGLKGLLSASNSGERVAYISLKIRANSCAFISGVSPSFQLFGDRPCNGQAIGNSSSVIGNPVVASVQGSSPAFTSKMSVSGGSNVTCNAAVRVTALISSGDGNTFAGDSVVYILPAQLKYVPGSFSLVSGSISSTLLTDNQITIRFPIKTSNTISVQFDISAANLGCAEPDYTVISNSFRSSGFICPLSFGSCRIAELKNRDTIKLKILQPQLSTASFSFLPWVQGGTLNITYTVNISNSGYLPAPESTYIAKIFCASDTLTGVLSSFILPAIPIGATVSHSGSFEVVSPNNCVDLSSYFIAIQDTLSNSNKACLCSRPAGSFSSGTLPVNLQNFTAVLQGNQVYFTWLVNAEQNTERYIIEYSVNAVNFVATGGIAATNSRYYSMLLSAPTGGTGYYRLKAIAANGKISYSDIRMIKAGTAALVSVYPNPAKDCIKISFAANMINRSVNLSLVSMDGKVLSSKKIRLTGQVELMNTSNLANGKYLIRIVTDAALINEPVEIFH